MKYCKTKLLALALSLIWLPGAYAIDWSAVPGQDLVLFYPGQTSWEWQLTQSSHSGAEKFRAGKDCHDCHKGEEQKIGDLMVSGTKAEPAAIKGKPGAIKVHVKAAHDGARVHFRIQWDSTAAGEKQSPEYAASAALMFDDGSVNAATRAGCWASCHEDLKSMPAASGEGLTKYLTTSRTKVTRQGGGESYKPQSELDAQLAAGDFLEYWQARMNPGLPPELVSGHVLEKRHIDDSPAVAVDGAICTKCDKWTVDFSRPLKVSTPGHKDIVPGETYTIGFSVHDYYTDERFHYVSFAKTFVLNEGTADFVIKEMP